MYTQRNRSFLIGMILFLSLLTLACNETTLEPVINDNNSSITGHNKAKAYESFSNTVNITSQTIVKLEAINGSVNLQSVTGTNQLKVSGVKIVSANTLHDANYHLKDIFIDIDELTNEIVIRTEQPQFSDGRSYVVNYTISIPSDVNISVKTINGSIGANVLVPFGGTVNLSLANGSIELNVPDNTSAEFSANIGNGNISLQDLTLRNQVATHNSLKGTLGDGDGLISLKTANGNIYVSGIE